MSVVSKLVFASTHPKLTAQFVERELRRRWRKASSKPYRHPRSRHGVIAPSHFFDGAAFDAVADVKAADNILKGKLCLYGQHHFTANPIDWHRDYLSDYTWPAHQFAMDITYSYPVGTDIKNPWEVSRAHHLVTVALAYKATGNEKYAEYVTSCISSWIDQNPFYLGVNWKVAMEVGIRAANWLAAYELIRESAACTSQFTTTLLGSMHDHGTYIMENLEHFGTKSNHYMSDLVGLVWIGKLCPSLPGASRWYSFGKAELEREIVHQFRADGINFEASLAYHRLVLELTGYTALLLHRQGESLNAAAMERLRSAFEATANLLKPNGEVAQFGDNDTGRMFIFAHYHTWTAMQEAYLLDLGSLLFPKVSPVGSDELGWLIDRKPRKLPLPTNTHFEEAGIAIQRAGDWHLTIGVAPIGQDGNGGHNHDDAGTFELTYKDQNIVVDPGTGHYTSNPAVRNHFRSASSHNAPVVRALAHEPHALLFVSDSFTKGVFKPSSVHTMRLEAEKYTVMRELKLATTGLEVTDTLEEPAGEQLTTLLTFPPAVKLKQLKEGIGIGDELILHTAASTEIVDVSYSPSYATVEQSYGIRIEGPGELTFTIKKR